MGFVLIIYLIGLSLSKIPAVQSWAAEVLSKSLTDYLGTTVNIGHVRPGLFNRLIIDDVKIYDQKDSLMLNAARMAAKIRILPLFEKEVHIDNAQMIGANIMLYKTDAKSQLNCQFLIDKFRKDKEDKTPKTNIQIGTLLVRRSALRYNVWNTPLTPQKFNVNHLSVNNIDVNAKVLYNMPDTISINLKRLSFGEACGFTVKQLSFMLNANNQHATLSDFTLQTAKSDMKIGQLAANYPYIPTGEDFRQWLQEANIKGTIETNAVPADFSCFASKLQNFNDRIHVVSEYIIQEGNLLLPVFVLSDTKQNIQLEANAKVQSITATPSININILQLKTSKNIQPFISKNIHSKEQDLSPYISNAGNMSTEGDIRYHNNTLEANLSTITQLGSISLQGKLIDKDKIQAKISTNKFNLGQLLSNGKPNGFGNIVLSVEANGHLHGKENKPELYYQCLINSLFFRNHEYRNIVLAGNTKGNTYSGNVKITDINGSVQLNALADIQKNKKTIQCSGILSNLSLYHLNLAKSQEGIKYSGKIDADIDFVDADHITGNIDITDAMIISEQDAPTLIDSICIRSHYNEEGQHLLLSSPIINAKAAGHFKWKDLVPSFLTITHQALPSIFPEPQTNTSVENEITFDISTKDTTLFASLTGTEIKIPETAVIQGEMNNITQRIILNANIPQLYYAGNDLRHTELHLESYKNIIQTSLKTERVMKGKATELNLNAYANQNKLITRLDWDNHKIPAMKGNINLIGYFHRDLSNRQAIEGVINTSDIIINDTTWSLLPAHINYHDNVVDVENIRLTCENRHIAINGRMSKESTDSLTADLNQIDLAYIFDLVNFHSVQFDGKTTGRVYATSVFQKPDIDGYLHVQDFTFNGAPMGDTDIYCNWGRKGKSITLDAHMRDIATKQQTSVSGTITPGKEEGSGLDLFIRANHTNIAFLNKWTKDIFRNLNGNVSGWTRLHGPFKIFTMEGDLMLNEAYLHVIPLGVDYHTAGDSVILRPGNIWLKNITLHDSFSNNTDTEHSAIIDGHLIYDRFSNMRYDIQATANNILGYDFHDFGDANFYGTIYANGELKLTGQPGILNVDVNVSPQKKSTLVYKVASPETLTEAGFITYVSHTDSTKNTLQETVNTEKPKTDIHINFNLDINPNATLKLLMDQRSGDYINLAGNGHILANYYNKGKFQIYGTYRVVNGTYKMSLQDVIRKDFQFERDGSIIFGGNPMQATLNLKALYTVPNVSLDDLSSSSLGLSNTKVDCIMNIGGLAGQPVITFDFDLPNANEDEKKMVRSMVNTEEERNMQVIYLLGIGRFYSYGAQYQEKGSGGQSSMAINSFLSSTISSQFNQILSNAVGSNNWTFGTNLRTGETGWDKLDVEGILSGRMLNNRLLINGNFGYRESYYSTNNFIGDFDIQYILTRNGDFSLKAYNQTNDRYFVQSSLTTQGLGIQFKRDFNNWKEAFRRQKTKTKSKTKTKTKKDKK
ncbi:MAG: translocation/assembly module TamB [Bacteroidaceae bacterium]|nr:translocation/assembly module TamB [Bacteroidaceae bacterium]